MNKVLKVFCIGLLLVALSLAVFVPFGSNLSVSAEANIVVVGEGCVSVAPNVATINIAVETRKEDLNQAVSENKASTDGIFEILAQAGYSEDDIQTKNFSVYQRFDYSNGEKFLGYQVRSSFEVRTKDLDRLDDLIKNLTASGANCVEGITFSCDNEDELYKQAIKLALENAKVKASALSQENLEVEKITEEFCYMNSLYRDCYSFASGKEISKGTIKVSAKVIVEFSEEIENNQP